jgi:FtsZ-binding cell division protein ZapB
MAINRLYSKQMKIDDMKEEKLLTKKQREELQSLIDEITKEAKKVYDDYQTNESDISGSVVHVHENSPYLDTENDGDEPLYSGSRWTKVLKSV